jgi:hypothetical protein
MVPSIATQWTFLARGCFTAEFVSNNFPISSPCLLAILSISREEHGANPNVSFNNDLVGS